MYIYIYVYTQTYIYIYIQKPIKSSKRWNHTCIWQPETTSCSISYILCMSNNTLNEKLVTLSLSHFRPQFGTCKKPCMHKHRVLWAKKSCANQLVRGCEGRCSAKVRNSNQPTATSNLASNYTCYRCIRSEIETCVCSVPEALTRAHFPQK